MSLFSGQLSPRKKPRKPRGAVIPKPSTLRPVEPPNRLLVEYQEGRSHGFEGIEPKHENRFLGTPLLLVAYKKGYAAGVFLRKGIHTTDGGGG